MAGEIMILQLRNLLQERLLLMCPEAFIYGSQLTESTIQKDIDLVLVCEDDEKRSLAQQLAKIQEEFPCLLHAIFVSRADIQQNPQLRILVRDASPLR